MGRRIQVQRASCPCHVISEMGVGMERVRIQVEDLDPLFGNELADVFLFSSSPHIREVIDLQCDSRRKIIEFSWEGSHSRQPLIEKLDEFRRLGLSCHFFWVGDDEFEHFSEESLECVKLGAISFFSGDFSPQALAKTMEIVIANDYEGDLVREDQFLNTLDQAQQIIFHSPAYEARAEFDHCLEEHWFSINGPLRFGDQAVLPTGEISTLTNESGRFSFLSRFKIDGELVLKGYPIVHRGSRNVSPEETSRMYSSLSPMMEFPVIATVRGGLIEELHSPIQSENPFLSALTNVFKLDERYRKIHEVGFGVNGKCADMLPCNFFSNERYPGVHFGLGLGGTTPFHIDLVCPDVEVEFEMADGERIGIYNHLGLSRR